MQTTTHPVADAYEIIDDKGLFNDLDSEHFTRVGQPLTDFAFEDASFRLLKYKSKLPKAAKEALLAYTAELQTRNQITTLAEVNVGCQKYMVVKHIDKTNKDFYKEASERIIGKRVLLWSLIEHPNMWAFAKVHSRRLLSSGLFVPAADVTANSLRTFTVPVHNDAPVIDWAELTQLRNPMPFQKEGIEFLVPALAEPGRGVLLADDQGLGKTIQAIMTAWAFKEKVTVLCPAGVRYNWASEIFMTHPTWTVCVYNDRTPYRRLASLFGAASANRFVMNPSQADVTIMSYQAALSMVISNTDPATCRFATMAKVINPSCASIFAGRILINDEMHYSKNVNTVRSKACLAVCRASKRVIALSGTPITNRTRELWPILVGINRWDSIAGSAADYDASYVKGSDYFGLHNKLMNGKFFIRRLKKDVLTQLPPKNRQDLLLEMSPRQQLEYESLRNSLKSSVKHGGMAKNGGNILALLTAMQTKANECKVEPILEMLEDRASQDLYTVVCSDRLAPLKEIHELCVAQGISSEMLHGGSSDPERKRILTEFAAGTVKVVLTTLSEGINLQRADMNIMLDLPWTPGKLAQKEDRIHRIGQTARVTIMRVIAASIDIHKRDVIASKTEIIDQAINGGDSPMADDQFMSEVIKRLTDD